MNLYPLGKASTGLLVRVAFRIKFEGTENIPPGGGYILACNHRSNFDPVIIAQKVPVQVYYLAKVELLKNPVAGFIISRLGIIPVKRGEGDNSAIEKAVEIVRGGGVLGVFPEGSRSKDGVPLRPRSGAAVIASQTGADVLPMAVTYAKGVRFGGTVTVRYGQMIPNSDLGVAPGSPTSLRKASKFVMDKIVALMDPAPSDEEEAR